MPLQKLIFRPGINREVTNYTNEGGWYDCDLIRFQMGFPEVIGGWSALASASFLGTCRSIHTWVGLSNEVYTGFGTNQKYYLHDSGSFFDLTPVRSSVTDSITFAATDDTLNGDITDSATTLTLNSVAGFPIGGGFVKIGTEEIQYTEVSDFDLTGLTRGFNSTTAVAHSDTDAVFCASLTVSHTAHGAVLGDFVTFSEAVALGGGGNMLATVLNQEYNVAAVVDADTYVIHARSAGTTIIDSTVAGVLTPTYVYSTAADTGDGGAGVDAVYQLSIGAVDTAGGGWDADTQLGTPPRAWRQDNFGEDLLYNVYDGGIYYWDASGGSSVRGVALSSLSGANLTPTIAKQILVSDRDRHIIVFGCDPETAIGTQDPLLIRFSHRESLVDWESTALNTAGELRMGSGSTFVTAVETRQQIAVFTDTALYSMQFIGAPYTFGINLISSNISIMGPNAAVAIDDRVFWMGKNGFYEFSGSVVPVECTVQDYVFDDFNETQKDKVFAGSNSRHGEVWWFYPSSGSVENDRYVFYNYTYKIWCFGAMARTAWADRGVISRPLAAGTDGTLYKQESGLDDGSQSPAAALSPYIQSAPLDIGEGDTFSFLERLFPDISFKDSTAGTPTVSVRIDVRDYPDRDTENDSITKSFTSTSEIQNIRMRGRQFSFKVSSSTAGVTWRLGSPRVDIKPDGRR